MKKADTFGEALKEYWQPLFVLSVITFAIFQTVATLELHLENREIFFIFWKNDAQTPISLLAIEFTFQSVGLTVLPVVFFLIFRQFPKDWHDRLAVMVAITFGLLAGPHPMYLATTVAIVSLASAIMFGLATGFRATLAFSIVAASMLGVSITVSIVAASILTSFAWAPLITAYSLVALRRGFQNFSFGARNMESFQ
jgi:hypothetical protein